jgi:protoporphyrinogen oxidase
MNDIDKSPKTALIIGAGPAGLTAALELIKHTSIKPIVLEQDGIVGGISRTVRFKGNRIDIGGHRFFSRSEKVINWWLDILPPEQTLELQQPVPITYHGQSQLIKNATTHTTANPDKVMLVRPRKSRILFRGQLLDYPLKLSFRFLRILGVVELVHILFSYISSRLFQRKENNLEDFYINRFGVRLYQIFFKEYTEKVWGQPCQTLSADWGAQRVKTLSIGKTILHAIRQILPFKPATHKTETSLIEQFMYPKFGPGQMWEEVTEKIVQGGGEIRMHHRVSQIHREENTIKSVMVIDTADNDSYMLAADYFISTMPIRNLLLGMLPTPSSEIQDLAFQLPYRDFITVGLLISELAFKEKLKDQWMYIQDTGVSVGRIQIFNNWSPAMVADPGTWWLGLEYFCTKGDTLWAHSDPELITLAKKELVILGVCKSADIIDGVVVRMPKAYPVYSGSYNQFDRIKEWLNGIDNLYPIGRNGMHRYNNQDHSMLTAIEAVTQIASGQRDMEGIWRINTEEDYHESK